MVAEVVALLQGPAREAMVALQVGADQEESGRYLELPQQGQQGLRSGAAGTVIDGEGQPFLPAPSAEDDLRTQRHQQQTDQRRGEQDQGRKGEQQGHARKRAEER